MRSSPRTARFLRERTRSWRRRTPFRPSRTPWPPPAPAPRPPRRLAASRRRPRPQRPSRPRRSWKRSRRSTRWAVRTLSRAKTSRTRLTSSPSPRAGPPAGASPCPGRAPTSPEASRSGRSRSTRLTASVSRPAEPLDRARCCWMSICFQTPCLDAPSTSSRAHGPSSSGRTSPRPARIWRCRR